MRDLNDGPAILYWTSRWPRRYRDLKRMRFTCLGDALVYVVDTLEDLRLAAWIETPNGEVLSSEMGRIYQADYARWKSERDVHRNAMISACTSAEAITR